MLDDLHVVDLSTEIAGPYCTKLLADAGADVVKVEPPGGDPLRQWGSGALFQFLNTSKRSIVADLASDEVRDLVAASDIVIDNSAAETATRDRAGLVVVSITPFGRSGPWAGRAATEFVLQAWCGVDRLAAAPPTGPRSRPAAVWASGSAARTLRSAAVAAWKQARRTGQGERVDVSLLECMSMTMNTFTSVFASFMGRPGFRGPARTIEIPSVEPTTDGYVGFCTITAQQFQDFLVLIERPDLIDDRDLASAIGRSKRMDEILAVIHDWTTKRTSHEIIELATLLRIPATPVGNGATLPTFEQFRARGTFVEHPGGGFVQPRVPYAVDGRRGRPFSPAPRLGEHSGDVRWEARQPMVPSRADNVLPLDGLRIIDFTAFWAGPAATHMLAALGADVVKVESVQRPDGMRYTTTAPAPSSGGNGVPCSTAPTRASAASRSTLNDPDGLALAKRLIEGADAVIENFSPRVMENFGLDWDAVHACNPQVVMVRMPAFGLDGPWRDRTGFAQTMEQITGMAWVTGCADGPPLIPRGACDPFAGMHAVLRAAHRARETRPHRRGHARRGHHGRGRAQRRRRAGDRALRQRHPVAARHGNRGPVAAPQGLYACAGTERWLALAVVTDEHWDALRAVMGDPDWARTVERRDSHDLVDAELAAWCADRELDDLVEELAAREVPRGARDRAPRHRREPADAIATLLRGARAPGHRHPRAAGGAVPAREPGRAAVVPLAGTHARSAQRRDPPRGARPRRHADRRPPRPPHHRRTSARRLMRDWGFATRYDDVSGQVAIAGVGEAEQTQRVGPHDHTDRGPGRRARARRRRSRARATSTGIMYAAVRRDQFDQRRLPRALRHVARPIWESNAGRRHGVGGDRAVRRGARRCATARRATSSTRSRWRGRPSAGEMVGGPGEVARAGAVQAEPRGAVRLVPAARLLRDDRAPPHARLRHHRGAARRDRRRVPPPREPHSRRGHARQAAVARAVPRVAEVRRAVPQGGLLPHLRRRRRRTS